MYVNEMLRIIKTNLLCNCHAEGTGPKLKVCYNYD